MSVFSLGKHNLDLMIKQSGARPLNESDFKPLRLRTGTLWPARASKKPVLKQICSSSKSHSCWNSVRHEYHHITSCASPTFQSGKPEHWTHLANSTYLQRSYEDVPWWPCARERGSESSPAQPLLWFISVRQKMSDCRKRSGQTSLLQENTQCEKLKVMQSSAKRRWSTFWKLTPLYQRKWEHPETRHHQHKCGTSVCPFHKARHSCWPPDSGKTQASPQMDALRSKLQDLRLAWRSYHHPENAFLRCGKCQKGHSQTFF